MVTSSTHILEFPPRISPLFFHILKLAAGDFFGSVFMQNLEFPPLSFPPLFFHILQQGGGGRLKDMGWCPKLD